MQIEISLATGVVKVEADIVGPFGVHKASPDLDIWRVTHLATGCAMPVLFFDRRQAMTFAEKIGPIKNFWADTAIEFTKQQSDQMMDIAVSLGGRWSNPPESIVRQSKLRRAALEKPLNGEDRFE